LPIFCGLDHRFGWSQMPGTVSLAGDALVALGLFMNLLVIRENSYGASNIHEGDVKALILRLQERFPDCEMVFDSARSRFDVRLEEKQNQVKNSSRNIQK
jgi:hypothetical protein